MPYLNINFIIEVPPKFYKSLQNQLLEEGFEESTTPITLDLIELKK